MSMGVSGGGPGLQMHQSTGQAHHAAGIIGSGQDNESISKNYFSVLPFSKYIIWCAKSLNSFYIGKTSPNGQATIASGAYGKRTGVSGGVA